MNTSTLFAASFDARDAARVARFWAAALGRDLADGADTDNAVVLPDDPATTGPRLAFHRVPEPKTVKNRLHFDLITSDIDSESARLIGLGATKLTSFDGPAHWVTFADPEGNEFDVIAKSSPLTRSRKGANHD
jgi:predicted enzyme related to lactoylglutathione lyase